MWWELENCSFALPSRVGLALTTVGNNIIHIIAAEWLTKDQTFSNVGYYSSYWLDLSLSGPVVEPSDVCWSAVIRSLLWWDDNKGTAKSECFGNADIWIDEGVQCTWQQQCCNTEVLEPVGPFWHVPLTPITSRSLVVLFVSEISPSGFLWRMSLEEEELHILVVE